MSLNCQSSVLTQHRRITIRCTRSRGPRGFFCLQVFRRGPVNVAVIRPNPLLNSLIWQNMNEQQLELSLIKHEVENAIIPQRYSDGYVNATEMCKAAGKSFADYNRLIGTKDFMNALSGSVGIPTDLLAITINTGGNYSRGTWVHPQVAIHLAQWCSPEFAVAVTQLVLEWSTGKLSVSIVPYHIKRYMANISEIPPTHFSMLNELTFGLIAPLEHAGYTLPDNMVPDISEGRMFSGWVRKNTDLEPKDFPTYKHRYEDGRVVDARLYPNSLLADFRKHFNEVWIPKRMVGYFTPRDPKAIPHIKTCFPKSIESETKKIE